MLERSRQERKRAALDAEAEENRDEGEARVDLTVDDKPLESAVVHDNWQNDPAERARRIYHWWVTHITADRSKMFYFSEALRLIVLVQPSSAAVERVFSQLQYIRHICGDKMLADMLNLRLLLRCNDGLEDSFDDQE